MQGKTHELIGLAVTATIIVNQPTIEPLASACLIAGSIIGSYFPDIDIPTSAAGDKFFIVTWPFYLFRWVLKLVSKILKPLKNSAKVLSHRGLFHSVLFYSVLFALFWTFRGNMGQIPTYILTGFYLGVFSHLFADFFTGGMMIFSPIYNKKIIPPIRFKSGGMINTICIVASTLVIAFDIYKYMVY